MLELKSLDVSGSAIESILRHLGDQSSYFDDYSQV